MAQENKLDENTFGNNRDFLKNFLGTTHGAAAAQKLMSLADGSSKDAVMRLDIDVNALRRYNATETGKLIRRPLNYLAAFQQGAHEFMTDKGAFDPKFALRLKEGGIQIGFVGSVGHHQVSPRGLLSNLICSLVCVEGIVTKCSLVQPKVVKSVHWCEKTGKYLTREYRDSAALDTGVMRATRDGEMVAKGETGSAYPTMDDEKNPLETEFGLSVYKNHQTVVIQEMPERAPLGQLPRSIDLVLDYDLVDGVKPGDRVSCMGIYRAVGAAVSANGASTTGSFKTKVLCNHVDVLGTDIGGVVVTGEDVAAIKELGARPDVLEVLAASFSPSVYGHGRIKEALILQLLGGCEKNLDNGTHLRGDVNILMVGDPSTAKSQLLRAAMALAPVAVSTTGRGSSGVGLTAAVTSDPETGERKLEAGAMVLADRGIVCIDEFDKMSDADRVAIHEVMEQQTVTIAKAGIHASLNARCSVLAAANPVYGQYNKDRRPQDNIGLPDSLLSRFDLLFVVLDQMDPETDRKISRHVLCGHQYRRPGTDMEPESLGSGMTWGAGGRGDAEDDEKTPVWNKLQPVLYSGAAAAGAGGKRRKTGGAADSAGGAAGQAEGSVLHKGFLKKFIHYAKKLVPVLSDEAREFIAQEYATLRAKAAESNRTLPVTARQLETLIRLSTANAKARLSLVVEERDAAKAASLMQFALYHAETADASVREDQEDMDPNDEGGGGGGGRAQGKRARVAARPKATDAAAEATVVAQAVAPELDLEALADGTPRFVAFSQAVVRLIAAQAAAGSDQVTLTALLSAVNGSLGGNTFTVEEAEYVLRQMEDNNTIMYSEGTIFSV